MLTLDLFNTRYERELQEGAVDNTVARLIEPLSLRAAEIRTQLRNGNLKGNEVKALEKEYEDLVAKRLDIIHGRQQAPQDECMSYSGLGEAGLPDVADKQAKMARLNQPGRAGTDVVTPQQRVAGATLPSNTVLGKARDTAMSFANWLAGKDDTGPTYEETKLAEVQADSRINAAKYVFTQIQKAFNDNVDIATINWLNSAQNITMTRNQIFHVMTKLQSMSRQNRNQFALQTLADRNNFALWLGGLKKVQPRPRLKAQTDPLQPELPLNKPQVSPVQERAQKKNSEKVAPPASQQVQRYLTKIRSAAPNAVSDIEAMAQHELDNQAQVDKNITNLEKVNARQDAALKKAMSLDRQQDTELNNVEQQISQLWDRFQTIKSAKSSSTATTDQPTVKNLDTNKKFSPGAKSTATSKKPEVQPTSTITVGPSATTQPAEVDPEIEKKIQGLETQINKLSTNPPANLTAQQLQTKLDHAESLLKQYTATAATQAQQHPEVLSPADQAQQQLATAGKKPQRLAPRLRIPAGDIDIEPLKQKNKPKSKAKSKPKAVPAPATDDEFDVLGLDPAELAAVDEGQLGQATPHAIYIDNQLWRVYADAKTALDMEKKVKASLKAQGRDQQVKVSPYYQGISEETQRLHQGDPIVVTAPNEFEGATGEIHELSPSGKFVIVNLYNHGKHSMHLSDVEYNDYADQEEDDDGNVNDINDGPQHAYNSDERTRSDQFEGYQDFNKKEPYEVCLAGKCVKTFDYYEDARRFHDNWKKKLYHAGDKAKADKITLNPVMKEQDVAEGNDDNKIYDRGYRDGFAGKPKNDKGYDGNAWASYRAGYLDGKQAAKSKQGVAEGFSNDMSTEDMIAYLRQHHDKNLHQDYLNHITSTNSKFVLKNIPLTSIRTELSGLDRAKVEQYKQMDFSKAPPIVVGSDGNILDGYHRATVAKALGIPTIRAYVGVKGQQGVAEAGSPAQQAAIAIAMKQAGKKPKSVDETTAFLTRSPRLSYGTQAQHTTLGPVQVEKTMPDGSVVVYCERDGKRYRTQPSALKMSVAEDTGSWIVYDPETRQIKKRFKTHTAGKSYARTHNLGFASSEYYFDNIKEKTVAENDEWDDGEWTDDPEQHVVVKAQQPTRYPEQVLRAIERNPAMRADIIADYKRKQGVAETVTDIKSEMAKVYRRLAPKIERYKDSFLAGQLYDELENIAELHGAEAEFKRMMAGARNRAHMDYDTNPGGFQNWFWYLPFGDQEISEESSTSSDAVERAILHRIMVDDKLRNMAMDVGMDKVFQAVEEVAYNVGDVDEIGSSDVSAWIHQVRQILGAE